MTSRMTIRAPKDFWSGLMFLAFAAVALLSARGYSLGSAGKMGPGYFPLLLGLVLALIGAILVARSFVIQGERVGRLSVLPLMAVVLGVCLFAFSIETLGLVVRSWLSPWFRRWRAGKISACAKRRCLRP